MEKTQKEIEQYLDVKIKHLNRLKKSANTIIKIKEQSNEVVRFTDKFKKDVETIISRNGIRDKEKTDKLMSHASGIFIARFREFSQIS